MRLRKPTKLGEAPESWLRHEDRSCAWVAKTWRYLVSLLNLVSLALCSVGFFRWVNVDVGDAMACGLNADG